MPSRINTTKAPLNGSDLLKAARASRVETSNRIAALEAQRRDALLAGDYVLAKRLTRRLAALRESEQLFGDAIELLAPVALREAQEADYPQTLEGARGRRAQLLERQDYLKRRAKVEASAQDDNELVANRGLIELLEINIRHMERLHQ
jgi:hypothetical protein